MISRLFFLGLISLCMCFSAHGQIGAEQNLLDYYNGDINLDIIEARSVVKQVMENPSNNYFSSLSHYVRAVMKDNNGDMECVLDFYEALRFLEDADTVDLYIEIQARKNIGVYMMERGRLNEALDLYNEALEYAGRYNEKEVYSLMYNTGNVYNAVGHEKALEYYEKVENYAKLNNDVKRLAQVNIQKGIYYSRNDTENSFYHFQLVLASGLDKEGRYGKYIGNAYQGLANLALKDGEYEKAISYLEPALELQSGGNLFAAYLDLGRSLYEIGLISESKDAVAGAMRLLNEVQVKGQVTDLFVLIEQVFQNEPDELNRYRDLEISIMRMYVSEGAQLSKVRDGLLFDRVLNDYRSNKRITNLQGLIDYNDLMVYFICTIVCLLALIVWVLVSRRDRSIDKAIDENDRMIQDALNKEEV